LQTYAEQIVSRLLDAITQLSGNSHWRSEMGERGRRFVNWKFQPERLTGQVIDIYTRILEQRGEPPADLSLSNRRAA